MISRNWVLETTHFPNSTAKLKNQVSYAWKTLDVQLRYPYIGFSQIKVSSDFFRRPISLLSNIDAIL